MVAFDLEIINRNFAEENPLKLLDAAMQKFGPGRIALASSLSIEDQVLTAMLLKIESKARIFFLDTGRHFQETYDLMEETMKRFNFHYEVYAPDSADLESLVSALGPNSFYDSVEKRKHCCEVRKVKPLRRVLGSVDAWISGLRREQSLTREDIHLWEWDRAYEIYKINPIAFWSEEQVWETIRKENIPYSNLYEKGYPSIGCEPCTRAVKPEEDVRSGRWWWEDPNKKECGLHPVNK